MPQKARFFCLFFVFLRVPSRLFVANNSFSSRLTQNENYIYLSGGREKAGHEIYSYLEDGAAAACHVEGVDAVGH